MNNKLSEKLLQIVIAAIKQTPSLLFEVGHKQEIINAMTEKELINIVKREPLIIMYIKDKTYRTYIKLITGGINDI